MCGGPTVDCDEEDNANPSCINCFTLLSLRPSVSDLAALRHTAIERPNSLSSALSELPEVKSLS